MGDTHGGLRLAWARVYLSTGRRYPVYNQMFPVIFNVLSPLSFGGARQDAGGEQLSTTGWNKCYVKPAS